MAVEADVVDFFAGQFDDVELIGRGGAGVVYRARQPRFDRMVAIKLLEGSRPGRAAAGGQREALVQGRISWHPNVLTVLEQGQMPDGTPYLVVDHAPGGSLASRVESGGPLDRPTLLRLGAELSSALAVAHEAGVVHCDVKPSNVLFGADGGALLADFGISRAAELSSETFDELAGSLAFVPPELLEGRRPGPANDVYSLALTLLFAATAVRPQGAGLTTPAAVVAAIQAGAVDLSGLEAFPSEVADVLRSATSTEPEARPDATALLDRFRAALAPVPLAPVPVPVGPRGADGVDEHRSASRGRAQGRWGRRGRRGVGRGAGLLGTMAVIALVLAATWVPARGGDAAPEEQVALCDSYVEFVEQREDMFESVSEGLELAASSVDALAGLLIEYPGSYADIVMPFLAIVRRHDPSLPVVTREQVAQMSQAGTLRALASGKAFVFDGESGDFDPAGLPWELRAPAEAFSEANELASSQCSVESDITAAKARMRSAIFSNLGDRGFMEDFFADPRAFDLFDTQFVLMFASLARGPLESLLSDRWAWFIEFLDRNSGTAHSVISEHPDLLLTALQHEPDAMPAARAREWAHSLADGLDKVGPAPRAGIVAAFPAEVEMLLGEDR